MRKLAHFACVFGAAAGESEAVFGEEVVAEVHGVRDAGQAGWPDESAEADGGVELAEDFDADDPLGRLAVFGG